MRRTIRRIEAREDFQRGRRRRGEGGIVAPGEAEEAVLAFGFPPLDAVFRGGGLAAGGHQVSAPAGHEPWAGAFALALLARLAASSRTRPALLIQAAEAEAEDGPFAAEGLRALGIGLDHVALLRTRTAQAAVQAADEALKSGAVSAVLLEGGERARIDLSLTRRFNLAARRAGALALLVGGAPEATSAALTRWRVAALPSRRRGLSAARPALGAPAFDLALTRSRLGPLGRWVVEWDCDEHVFKPAAPALPLPLAPLAVGRGSAALGERARSRAAGAGRQAG